MDNATVGEILKDNGYATSWFGKNHNTPDYQYSTAGPFGQWPTGMGFEYFYGFMGGETDQWTPFLFRNTTQIFPWRDQPGYNMITGMADDAIQYLNQLNAAAPDKPFFLYYVPGGSHAPHQPTPEWIDKFKGKFDMGWNELREQIFANQKRLGVIPPNTTLTPWPDGQPEYGGAKLPKWDTLSADEKKLFARQAEVFAAYVAYTDHEIGRVIQAVDDMGKLDNTLVIYISGDNGTSAEGSTIGTPFDLAALEAVDVPVADQLKFYDVWGSARTTPHMAVAWSWAFDTPFKWMKQVASHFGGTRQGMAIAWPNRIKDAGGIRTQFHHLIDIVPTILDVTGIPAPKMVNGIAQKPIEGVSMAYTFDKANANAPSAHTTQYFEMLGNRAIYHDGWMASTTPPKPPWLLGLGKMPDVVNGYKWELYHVAEDYSQANDLAATMPDKLRDMQELFLVEAAKYQVFPLDNDFFKRVLAPKPSYTAGRNEFTYAGNLTGTPNGDAPNILAKSYTITADVEVPSGRWRWDDRHRRRPLRRLRTLFAQRQAGLHLQSARGREISVGRPGAAHSGQAHSRIRLQVRRSRFSQGRRRRAPRGWQGGREQEHRPYHSGPFDDRRDLRHWLGHAHAGGRHRLSGALPLHRHDQQGGFQTRTAADSARGQQGRPRHEEQHGKSEKD